jgi:hypothetical protein
MCEEWNEDLVCRGCNRPIDQRNADEPVEVCDECEAKRELAEAVSKLTALRQAIARAATDMQTLSRWRKDRQEYDEDMGHEPRDFSDNEEWDRMEAEAEKIRKALATAERNVK